MMHFSTLVYVILFLATLSSCAQQPEASKPVAENSMIPVSEQYKDVTDANFVEKMNALVQHYDEEPTYFLRPLQSNCVFEILVNDRLIYKEYTLEKLASPLNINYGILSSGTQEVTVRLYPIGDLIQKTYGGESKPVTTLPEKTQMNIEVVRYKNYNSPNVTLDDEEPIVSHSIPTLEGTEKFVGAGLDFFEYSFTFEAEVPYNIEGYRRGQDLREIPIEELEAQVIDYYNKMQSAYLTKNKDVLARAYFGDLLILAQTNYSNKSYIEEIWQETKRNLNKEGIEFNDLKEKNYQINFYGDGRLVALKHSSKEPVDRRLRGKSAFWFKFKNGNRIRAQFPSLDLYLPKGESLENLRRVEY